MHRCWNILLEIFSNLWFSISIEISLRYWFNSKHIVQLGWSRTFCNCRKISDYSGRKMKLWPTLICTNSRGKGVRFLFGLWKALVSKRCSILYCVDRYYFAILVETLAIRVSINFATVAQISFWFRMCFVLRFIKGRTK